MEGDKERGERDGREKERETTCRPYLSGPCSLTQIMVIWISCELISKFIDVDAYFGSLRNRMTLAATSRVGVHFTLSDHSPSIAKPQTKKGEKEKKTMYTHTMTQHKHTREREPGLHSFITCTINVTLLSPCCSFMPLSTRPARHDRSSHDDAMHARTRARHLTFPPT